MNSRSKTATRHLWTGVALAAGLLCALPAWALGLGRMNVQSALGESLQAEIEITSITAAEAESLRVRVASPEAYRAAGVEFNPALSGAQLQVVRGADGRSLIRISSERAVREPFVELIVEATWASGRLVREYTMLFDPPSVRAAQAPVAPATAPVQGAAPASAPAPAPAPAPAVAAASAPVRAALAPAPAPAPERAARKAGPDAVRVQPGDTLGRIAARTQRPGVSLDQMLVSLYRANPQAFIRENMNLLRSGAVLTVPVAEEVGRVENSEARQIIRAQAEDFNAFRQRLAGAATARAETAPTRQATGRVQTQVQERAAAAPAPDRLTLSRPTPQASAPAAQASSETERRDAANRAAELARNVETLRRLQGAASAPAVAAAPAAPAPAPAAASEAAPPAVSASVAVAPPLPVAAPASAPAEPAAAPPVVAASEPPAPPLPVPPMSTPEQPPAEQGTSLIDSVLAHPLALPGAGLVVVLLGGLAYFAIRSRRKQGRETSFLESRLQPDSFFGASGGQRIDTHEAGSSTTGNASSISYSLSQLDAIGDVDPVAEADVYLAYGRDLQAEEILKEAMRSDPDRMAIRTKLLEVYAKRRDVKGFELLATQLHSLTRGQGDDWAKAQALGLSIDPDNPLYQPGGNPGVVLGSRGEAVEPLGASTMPYTAPAGPPSFQPAPDATLDLALDLELPAKPPTQQDQAPAAAYDAAEAPPYEPELPTLPVAPPVGAPPSPAAMPDVSLDFDLGEPAAPQRVDPDDAALDFGDFGVEPQASDAEDPEADALSRKLELAEEFRQIGDLEGARDLLEEVLAKADGALRSKAQSMLDAL